MFSLKSIEVAISETNISNGIGTDSFYVKFYEIKTLKEKFMPQLLKMLISDYIPDYLSEN
jgi:hypothetical protein